MRQYKCDECGSEAFTGTKGDSMHFPRVVCAECGKDHGPDVFANGWMCAQEQLGYTSGGLRLIDKDALIGALKQRFEGRKEVKLDELYSLLEYAWEYPEPEGDQMTVDAYKCQYSHAMAYSRFIQRDKDDYEKNRDMWRKDWEEERNKNVAMQEKLDELIVKMHEFLGIDVSETGY